MSESPIKDLENSHPVPEQWRGVIKNIVDDLAREAFDEVARRVDVKMSKRTAAEIRRSIRAYGQRLAPLNPETWRSSVSQWMDGWWDVVVDLWTAEGGESDLVLTLRVLETARGYRFEVEEVYVP